MTIEHLGLRLYSTLPPVISELVSNAYDAESRKVEIIVPTDEIKPESEVIIRDFGHGMSGDALQDEYLPIGRNRRGAESKRVKSKNDKVVVTGRKGLGKLSSFGIAEEMDIRSICSGEAITLRLNYADMKEWARDHSGRDYEPQVVPELSGPTSDADGVEVTLRKLFRTRGIDEDNLRRGIAQRLAMIGSRFQVLVNGTAIGPGDRTRKELCVPGYIWKIEDLPANLAVPAPLEIEGWIGFVPGASQTGRGVDIFANNKAVELGSYFNNPSTHAQFARAHLVGEIHAYILDAPTADLISTARNSVVWESPEAQQIQEWGQAVLQWAFEMWVTKRREAKTETIIRETNFDTWLEGREPRERRAAKRMIQVLAHDDDISPDSAKPLLEIIKSSVESVAFHDLIQTLESDNLDSATLLRLFDEWRVIEAREHLKRADGRLAAVNQLKTFMEQGALEVQELQPLITKNLWLIDPLWSEANEQATYSSLLRENCTEPTDTPETDRRLDIFAVSTGQIATIVELKHPKKTLSRNDLDQIEDYVDWARSKIVATGPDAPLYVHGLLVVGELSGQASVRNKMVRLSGDDIRVEVFNDIYERAKKVYEIGEERLSAIAPEYTRKARRKSAQAKAK